MEKNINSKRLLSLDIARGLSVFFVVIVHTLWMYGSIETQEGWLGDIVHFIGKGTGMFLIAMGVSYTLSRNQNLLLSVKRAFMVLLVGYGMNFLKFIFPILINITPEEFIAAYGWKSPLNLDQYLYLLRTGDILQMAGFSLFLMGLVNHFIKNKYGILIVAALIVGFSRELSGVHIESLPTLDYAFDILWSNSWSVYFPIFPWTAFIFLGMFFGRWYNEMDRDEVLLYKKVFPIGLALLAVGGALCLLNFEYHFGNFYHLGPGGAIYLMGFNLLLFCFAQWLAKKFKDTTFSNTLIYMSKRVTSIYVIQWVLICWGMYFLGYQRHGAFIVICLLPISFTLTFLTQRLLDSLLSTKPVQVISGKHSEEPALR